MSGRVAQRVVGLALTGVAAFVLLGGASAGAGGTAAGWTALGAPHAPTEGIGEVGKAISCPTDTSCAAVGYFEDTSDRQEAFVMDGSGSDWTPTEVTLPGFASTTAPDASLVSVSCYSAGNCVAAGGYQTPEPSARPLLVSETDGTWGAGFDSPALPGNVQAWDPVLVKISCSAQVCAAVGSALIGTSDEGYIVFGSGDSWTSLVAPLPADAAAKPSAEINDVSCAGSTCEAVGDYVDTSGNTQGVILDYDGTTWTTSEAPLPAGAATSSQSATAQAISCPATGSCSAVGNYTNAAGVQKPLLLSETSGTWSATKGDLPAGSPSNPHPEFLAIDCSQPGDCGAVGFDDADNHNNQSFPLAVAQTGGVWSAAVNPHLPADAIDLSTNLQQSDLQAVSCPSSSHCEAGGFYTMANESNPGLVVQFNGSNWSAGAQAPLPTDANPGQNQASRFFGLSCAGSVCEGVGWYKGPFGQMDRALILGSGLPSAGVAQAARAHMVVHAANVPVSCRGKTSCTVTLTLANKTGKGTLGQSTATAQAQQSKVVQIKLNAQGLKLLAAGKRSLATLLSVSQQTLLVSAQKLSFRR